MADRVLTWHIPTNTIISYYLDTDYEAVAFRVKAETAPSSGDAEIDVLADGVSIFQPSTIRNRDYKLGVSEIAYNTLSGTFTVGETLTGGTSGATGTLIKDDRVGLITLHNKNATSFSAGETVTGGLSGATVAVLSYHRASDSVIITDKTSTAFKLTDGDAEDVDYFEFSNDVFLPKGTWVTLSQGNLHGANNVSIHLELDKVADDESEA